MFERVKERIARSGGQAGFTLYELLAVLLIIGVLLAIAIPAYISFRGRADTAAAQANVRAAIPAVEAYYGDTGNTYVGMTLAKLQASYDAAVKNITIGSTLTTTLYCISSTVGAATYRKNGPSAGIEPGTCS